MCTVEPTWLSELAPHFYTFKDEKGETDKGNEGGGAVQEIGEDRGKKHPKLF